jgi:hypothetical protein
MCLSVCNLNVHTGFVLSGQERPTGGAGKVLAHLPLWLCQGNML